MRVLGLKKNRFKGAPVRVARPSFKTNEVYVEPKIETKEALPEIVEESLPLEVVTEEEPVSEPTPVVKKKSRKKKTEENVVADMIEAITDIVSDVNNEQEM